LEAAHLCREKVLENRHGISGRPALTLTERFPDGLPFRYQWAIRNLKLLFPVRQVREDRPGHVLRQKGHLFALKLHVAPYFLGIPRIQDRYVRRASSFPLLECGLSNSVQFLRREKRVDVFQNRERLPGHDLGQLPPGGVHIQLAHNRQRGVDRAQGLVELVGPALDLPLTSFDASPRDVDAEGLGLPKVLRKMVAQPLRRDLPDRSLQRRRKLGEPLGRDAVVHLNVANNLLQGPRTPPQLTIRGDRRPKVLGRRHRLDEGLVQKLADRIAEGRYLRGPLPLNPSLVLHKEGTGHVRTDVRQPRLKPVNRRLPVGAHVARKPRFRQRRRVAKRKEGAVYPFNCERVGCQPAAFRILENGLNVGNAGLYGAELLFFLTTAQVRPDGGCSEPVDLVCQLAKSNENPVFLGECLVESVRVAAHLARGRGTIRPQPNRVGPHAPEGLAIHLGGSIQATLDANVEEILRQVPEIVEVGTRG